MKQTGEQTEKRGKSLFSEIKKLRRQSEAFCIPKKMPKSTADNKDVRKESISRKKCSHFYIKNRDSCIDKFEYYELKTRFFLAKTEAGRHADPINRDFCIDKLAHWSLHVSGRTGFKKQTAADFRHRLP